MTISKNMMYGIVGAVVGVLLLFVLIPFMIGQGVVSDGNKQEAALSTQFLNNQNYLSDCTVRIAESANVIKGQTDALKTIIHDAVTGRYSQPGSPVVDSGKLFSAISEAYPNTQGLSDSFNQLLNTVNGCRKDFRDQQTVLLDKIRTFDSWRTGSWTVRTFGGNNFPDNNLYANFGNQSLTGVSAENKMRSVILSQGAIDSYGSGVVTPTNPFGTPTAAPSSPGAATGSPTATAVASPTPTH